MDLTVGMDIAIAIIIVITINTIAILLCGVPECCSTV